MTKQLEILLSADDLDYLIGLESGTVQRYVDAGIHPPWVWKHGMKRPRWKNREFATWLRILGRVSLDGNGAPLANPHEEFGPGGPADAA